MINKSFLLNKNTDNNSDSFGIDTSKKSQNSQILIFDFATLGKIKRTYKNRRGSRRIFIFNNYDGYLILSQFVCLK